MTQKQTLTSESHHHEQLMDLSETAHFLNMSKSSIYKLTCQNLIPFYRPGGRKLIFKKSDILKWLDKSKVLTQAEAANIMNNQLLNNLKPLSL